jgi:hypothetical protein
MADIAMELGISVKSVGEWAPNAKEVEAFKIGRGTYGSPRVLVELVEQGLDISWRRIAGLMRERRLQGVYPCKF